MSELRVSKLKGIGASLNQVSVPPGNDLRIGTEGTIDMRNTGALQLPTGNTGASPSSPAAGYMRFNTDNNRVEFYSGSTWLSLAPPFILYDNGEFDSFIAYMAARKNTWAASGTNFQYETDSSDDRIGDAQSDMYDTGNYTQVRVSGSASGNIGYNGTRLTYSGVKYAPLGYSWPLVAIAVAPVDTSTTYGFSRSGNLGADGGGGTPNSITVYNNATVQGFNPVNAWFVNKAWNQNSDPLVGHLYVTVGSPSWGSSVANGFTTTDFASSSDNDYSQYQSTSTNCFVMTALLSNGQTVGTVSVSQAQTFVSNFLADAKNHFGY